MFYALLIVALRKVWVGAIIIGGVIGINMANWQYIYTVPGTNIESNRKIAEFIYQNVGREEDYHVVLLTYAEDHLDLPVRYFLSTTDHPPVAPELSYTVDKLFIIDDKHDAHAATDSALFDIVILPDKTIRERYWPLGEERGPEIYVLYNTGV
jgi:hypothetical protein